MSSFQDQVYENFKQGIPVSEIAKRHKVTIRVIQETIMKAKKKERLTNEAKETPENIELKTAIQKIDANVNTRTCAYNALRRNGIHTIGDLKKISIEDITKIRGIGEKTAKAIVDACLAQG